MIDFDLSLRKAFHTWHWRRWIWVRDKLQEKLPRVTWRLVYVVVKLVLRVRAGMLYDHELITCKLVTFVHCIPFWAILKKIAHSRTEDWTVYLCMFVCMGYVTPIRLRLLYCPVKWSTNEMARSNSTFLKVNQGDIDCGHLENVASWKHLNDFSTLSDRSHFFTLRPSNVFIFPGSAKLVP